MVLIEWYCSPSLNTPARNSKKGWTEHESGSTSLSVHQLFHLFHALWYAVFVPVLHPAASSWEVSAEIPVAKCLLIASRRLAVVVPIPRTGVGCRRGPSIVPGCLVEGKGRSISSSSRAGYHGCNLHIGATSTSDAFSSLTFLRHLPIRQNGGNASAIHLSHCSCSASVPIAFGSGLQLTNSSSWALSLVANRSTAHFPNVAIIC